jgi:thiamine pyrophosphate-dependent acetolactate synthase large subunit-like protein
MNAAELTAEILKREGVEFLACYPRNALIESCATAGIRPIICRQERVGVGIADGYSRNAGQDRIGVFAAQSGPGIENAYPGIAQAYADNVPILVLPSGSALQRIYRRPAFDAVRAFESVTKWAARAHSVDELPELLYRAFHLLRSGRGGPVLLEVPAPLWQQEFSGELEYTAARAVRSAPDPADTEAAAELLLSARAPVIWAGQGVIRANATDALVELAEFLDIPVLTTNPGKSAFPENHPLSLGASAVNSPPAMTAALENADLVFAVGSSLTWTPFNPVIPRNKRFIHLTNAADDVNKEVRVQRTMLGDAQLGLSALLGVLQARVENPRSPDRAKQTMAAKHAFRDAWTSELESAAVPLSPYRIINELQKRLASTSTVITHDSGSPREHLMPFWQSQEPRGYIGWGKTTQLGHSLGLVMGASLAQSDKTCIAVMGDAAFCMTGLDLDTAVKNRLPILLVILNNSVMACERDQLKVSREKFDAFDIGGNYADIATALGCWSRRVDSPDDIAASIDSALEELSEGRPALLEFITKECYDFAGKSYL